MINGWNEALDIVNGNRRMFSYLKPEQFAGAKPPATAGAYVDALAKRLVHQTLSAKEKAAILGIAGRHRQHQGRRVVQRRADVRRAGAARIPAAPPPVSPLESSVSTFPSINGPVTRTAPTWRGWPTTRFDAVLRAEAMAVEAEDAAERDRLPHAQRARGGAAGRPRRDPADVRHRRGRDRDGAGHHAVHLDPGVVRGDEDRHADPRLPLRRAGRPGHDRAGRRPGAGQGPPGPADPGERRHRAAARVPAQRRVRAAEEVPRPPASSASSRR